MRVLMQWISNKSGCHKHRLFNRPLYVTIVDTDN